MNTKKYNWKSRSLTIDIPDYNEFQGCHSDFRPLKRAIIKLEQKALKWDSFQDWDEHELTIALLNLRDPNWFISNVAVQKIFQIDYLEPLNEDTLTSIRIPDFIDSLRDFILGKVDIVWYYSYWVAAKVGKTL